MREQKTEPQDVLMPGVLPMTWLAYATEQGMPTTELVREADLVAEEADAFAAGVPLAKVARLTHSVIERSSDPAIGIEIGWRLPLTSFGDMGHAMLASATVGEALQVLQRFWQLMAPELMLHVALYDGLAVGTISTPVSMQNEFRRVTIEAAAVTFFRGVQALTAEGAAASEIWFDSPEPDYGARVREKIPKVRFGMPLVQCRLPMSFLDRPLPMASVVGQRAAIQRLERQEHLQGLQALIGGKVQARLGFDALGYPSLEATAEVLHMTERTLRRRLQDEGTSYSELLDEARRRDAVRLLGKSDLDVGAIAERLGYNDAANFTRAFRKWAGMAPSQFRAAQLTR